MSIVTEILAALDPRNFSNTTNKLAHGAALRYGVGLSMVEPESTSKCLKRIAEHEGSTDWFETVEVALAGNGRAANERLDFRRNRVCFVRL
ncbi:hypothetical protein [Methylosinus sp. Ce-a6]|uniref:hypothetical protein n=1 Tax=Methylosinus sp. Ce-a6 TaxID=2172005 RepID=UPI001359B5DE|nr:hypothetical protein [Methylosinus sp. Ce-a6]